MTLLFENSKERKSKTFAKKNYLFLGIALTAVGVYYFTTQFNSDRVEEWLPLGLIGGIGIVLIIANRLRLKLPGSKDFRASRKYFYDDVKKELQVIFESNTVSPKTDQTISLQGVTEVDVRVEESSRQVRETRVKHDPLKFTPLGQSSPTGTYTTTNTKTYNTRKVFLILMPSGEEVQLKNLNSVSANQLKERLNNSLKGS